MPDEPRHKVDSRWKYKVMDMEGEIEHLELPNKGLKQAIKEYKQKFPNKLQAIFYYKNKQGTDMEKLVQLREVNKKPSRWG